MSAPYTYFKVLVDEDEQLSTCPNNSLKVIVRLDDLDLEVHFNFTHEGLITDVVDPSNEPLLLSGTSSETYIDLINRLDDEGLTITST